MSIISVFLAIVFYSLITIFYLYSKGKIKVKGGKEAQYEDWVAKYGEKAQKACLTLLVIYSMFFIIQLIT